MPPSASASLNRRTLALTAAKKILLLFTLLGCLLFLPAGTFSYPEAWTYLIVMFIPVITVTIYYLIKDPRVIERRMRMREKEREQKKIIGFGWMIFLATFLLPGFDKRFGWSDLPVWLIAVSDGVVLLGYLIFFFVLRENRFASRIIEVETGQHIITTGPYGIIRHPMYAGVLLMYLFSPLALGSLPAAVFSLSFIGLIVARIRNEETVLKRDLPGYADYMKTTRYRLLPRIW